jgi:hypothetical protein
MVRLSCISTLSFFWYYGPDQICQLWSGATEEKAERGLLMVMNNPTIRKNWSRMYQRPTAYIYVLLGI